MVWIFWNLLEIPVHKPGLVLGSFSLALSRKMQRLSTFICEQLNSFIILMNKDNNENLFIFCLLGFLYIYIYIFSKVPAAFLISCVDLHPFANLCFTGAKIKHSFFMLSHKHLFYFFCFLQNVFHLQPDLQSSWMPRAPVADLLSHRGLLAAVLSFCL